MGKGKTVLLAILFLLLLVLPLSENNYFLHLGTYVSIMVILAVALHIFFGLCGQIDFGINGFYAAGAYFAALIMKYLGLHFFIALPLSMALAGLVTLIVGLAVLELRHWVLALGTAAFGLAVWLTLRTVAVGFLGGDDGIFLAKLSLFGIQMGPVFYYYFIVAWTVLACLGAYFLGRSRVGRAMQAIREDEIAAAVMGIDVNHYIRLAFVIHGVYAGLAGGLYAQWNGWVSPGSFSTDVGMVVLVFVVVGGLGSVAGAIVGAVILSLLPELLIPLREYQILIFALIFFLVIRFMSKGLIGAGRDLWTRFFSPPIKARSGLNE